MTAQLLALVLCVAADGAPDTAVVCPQQFRAALEPWLEYRRGEGHRIVVLENDQTADELRDELRRIADRGALHYVLLVGDADPAQQTNRVLRERCVPTHHARAVVNVKFGSEPEIASDNWYADLDDDRLPDVAIGRLTPDAPADVRQMVQKILAYERSADFGPWRRQIQFVAGLGGFGPMADAVLEASAKSLIGAGVPAPYTTTMTYGSWQSPYCPDPRQFRQVTIDRLNEGSLFWVYIGHGQQRSVDEVHVPGGHFPILTTADVPKLASQHGATIACFLACYSGAFDQPRYCLAEELLRKPGGPVAVLCGSRVTMPYAMSVMGSELLRQVFVEHVPTLGEALMAAKRQMMQTENLSPHRRSLDAVARTMSPTADSLEAERAEHLDLFNLLGDPLLRIPYPKTVELTIEPTAAPGSTISIAGETPLGGTAIVELVVRRDRLTFKPPRRSRLDADTLATYAETYVRANEPRLASTQLDVRPGKFATQLEVPADAHGACHIRVFVSSEDGCAAGAADVRIEAVEPAAANP